jgi:hypothetical protein
MSLITDSHKFKQGKTGILLYFINKKNVFEQQIYITGTVSIKTSEVPSVVRHNSKYTLLVQPL